MVGGEPSVIDEDAEPRLCWESLAWNLLPFESGEFFGFDPTSRRQVETV